MICASVHFHRPFLNARAHEKHEFHKQFAEPHHKGYIFLVQSFSMRFLRSLRLKIFESCASGTKGATGGPVRDGAEGPGHQKITAVQHPEVDALSAAGGQAPETPKGKFFL